MSDKARERRGRNASGFVQAETVGNGPSFICYIEKRLSTAALENGKREWASNHGHVVECGSVLPLLNARSIARLIQRENFREHIPGDRFMACQGRWVAIL
jgi:hypothetical protein